MQKKRNLRKRIALGFAGLAVTGLLAGAVKHRDIGAGLHMQRIHREVETCIIKGEDESKINDLYNKIPKYFRTKRVLVNQQLDLMRFFKNRIKGPLENIKRDIPPKIDSGGRYISHSLPIFGNWMLFCKRVEELEKILPKNDPLRKKISDQRGVLMQEINDVLIGKVINDPDPYDLLRYGNWPVREPDPKWALNALRLLKKGERVGDRRVTLEYLKDDVAFYKRNIVDISWEDFWIKTAVVESPDVEEQLGRQPYEHYERIFSGPNHPAFVRFKREMLRMYEEIEKGIEELEAKQK